MGRVAVSSHMGNTRLEAVFPFTKLTMMSLLKVT